MRITLTAFNMMRHIKTIFENEICPIKNFYIHSRANNISIDTEAAKKQEAALIDECNRNKSFQKLGYKFISIQEYLENYAESRRKWTPTEDLYNGDIVCMDNKGTYIFIDLKTADKYWLSKQYIGTVTEKSFNAFTNNPDNKLYALASANGVKLRVISANKIKKLIEHNKLNFVCDNDDKYIKGIDLEKVIDELNI